MDLRAIVSRAEGRFAASERGGQCVRLFLETVDRRSKDRHLWNNMATVLVYQ